MSVADLIAAVSCSIAALVLVRPDLARARWRFARWRSARRAVRFLKRGGLALILLGMWLFPTPRERLARAVARDEERRYL